VTYLAPIIFSQVFQQVFTEKLNPNYTHLTDAVPLLQRVSDDEDTKTRLVFESQIAWFKLGASAKGVLKVLFEKLLELNLVRIENIIAWKDDVKEKPPGKPKALLQINSWITEIAPKPKKRRRRRRRG